MKKKLPFVLLLLLIILTVGSLSKLTPKTFEEISEPYRETMLHSYGDRPEYDALLPAFNDFGDSSAFALLNEALSCYTFRLDPRSLIPVLYQPQDRVDICILYSTGSSSGGLLLWDEDTLWVSSGGTSYVAYRPDRPDFLWQELTRLVKTYGESL